MFPTYSKFVFHYAQIFNTQVSTNGLYALAYEKPFRIKKHAYKKAFV